MNISAYITASERRDLIAYEAVGLLMTLVRNNVINSPALAESAAEILAKYDAASAPIQAADSYATKTAVA